MTVTTVVIATAIVKKEPSQRDQVCTPTPSVTPDPSLSQAPIPTRE